MPQRVAPELVLALLLLVLDGVEEGAIVGGPDDGADALDFAGERLAGFQILDVQRVLAEAGGVGGVGQPAAVVGDVGCADGEEGVALGELVAVEDDLLGCVEASVCVPVSKRDLGHPGRCVAALRQWMAYCWPSSVRV